MNLHKVTLPYYNDSLRNWIETNTNPRSVFLTNTIRTYGYSTYYSVLLSGRRLYVHDIAVQRDLSIRKSYNASIYSAQDKFDVCGKLMNEKIDYVVVDNSIRESDQYKFREDFLLRTSSLSTRI